MIALLTTTAGVLSEASGEGLSSSKIVVEVLPGLLLGLLSLSLFFKGAALSEKCVRVAPLVNSLFSDGKDNLDDTRQYTVMYINNSLAGFYVKEVRLSMLMAMKITYLGGACLAGWLVQLFT
jgi:hypothetical protein